MSLSTMKVGRSRSTNLPDRLRAGIESLSGMSMGGVQVHYDSPRPAQVDALAYTQGRDIHLAPGQEEHLAHEAWHVVQQARGRVRSTGTLDNGARVNEDHALEREADVMGKRAQGHSGSSPALPTGESPVSSPLAPGTAQGGFAPVQRKPKSLRARIREKQKNNTPLTAREQRFLDQQQRAQAQPTRTFFHITGSPGFANTLAAGRQRPTPLTHAQLQANHGVSIDPRFTQRSRTATNPIGDSLRPGDDLGPGFYTTDSAAFVDHYLNANFSGGGNEHDARILSFQVPANSFRHLDVQDNRLDDEDTFQRNMRDGFATQDVATRQISLPRLDAGVGHDIVSGPINDVATPPTRPTSDGTTRFSQGTILRLANETPRQQNFASRAAVDALYDNSQMSVFNLEQWRKHRAAR